MIVFPLHTTTGAYILTLYEKRVAEDDLPYFLSLMLHEALGGWRNMPAVTASAVGKRIAALERLLLDALYELGALRRAICPQT